MIVEAQYNWKGVLTNYRQGESFVPLDLRNRDYQVIQQAIAKGECQINEPAIGNVNRAFDR